MSPSDPYDRPLRITPIDDELVFLGEGKVAFSMDVAAARQTFHNLAAALLHWSSVQIDPNLKVVILLVEDEPLIQDIAAAILEDAGYGVIAADNARQALAALESAADIHLLFTDINMPGELDGLQLAQLVSRRWPAIPLILTSGRTIGPIADLPAGGRFLAKPYLPGEVLRHIGELTAA